MSKAGLALGGGGARGLAHIGVLKVLGREGIKIKAVSGCSIGSLIGGLYAYFGDAEKTEAFMRELIKNPMFGIMGFDKLEGYNKAGLKSYFDQFLDFIGIRIKAVMALERISYFDEKAAGDIFEMIPAYRIEKFKIKFSAVTTDLLTGDDVTIRTGQLRDAVRASSSVPGIFPPVIKDNMMLIDGSATDTIPAARVRNLGADRVIAVDVSHELKALVQPRNVYDVMFRTEAITSHHLSRLRLKEADIVISPDVKHISWTDLTRADEIIKAGEEAASEKLEEIKRLMNSGRVTLRVKRYLKRINGE